MLENDTNSKRTVQKYLYHSKLYDRILNMPKYKKKNVFVAEREICAKKVLIFLVIAIVHFNL